MTNKEKYKQAFSVLQTSTNISLEVEKMSLFKRRQKMNMAIIALVVCCIGGMGTVYAANVGGIQRTIQLWVQGDQTDAIININEEEGTYHLHYQGEEARDVHGGGVAIEADGSERPLTAEEILEEIYSPEVRYNEDGTVWVYYYDQAIEITDKFNEDNICRVKLSKKGEETLYMTVRYKDGFSYSADKYVD